MIIIWTINNVRIVQTILSFFNQDVKLKEKKNNISPNL